MTIAGLANDVAVGVNAFKYPKDYSKKQNATAVAVIVGGKTTKVAGIFQQQAKAVANAVAASRPDLTVRRPRQALRRPEGPPRRGRRGQGAVSVKSGQRDSRWWVGVEMRAVALELS